MGGESRLLIPSARQLAGPNEQVEPLMPRLVHPDSSIEIGKRRFSLGFAIRVVIYLIIVAVLVIVIMRTIENNVA